MARARRSDKKSKSKKKALEIIEIEITSVGAQGDGIGEGPDGPIYVPMTMAGDTVKASITRKDRNGTYANLVEVITPSADRTEGMCKHFGKCGGCSLQMMPDDMYKKWVKSRAVAAIAHHGFDGDLVTDPILSPVGSRRRVAFKVLKTAGGLVFGFNASGSHQVVPMTECPVAHEAITSLFAPLKQILTTTLGDRAAGTVHATLTATGVDLLIDVPMKLSLDHRVEWAEFADKHDIAAIHWQDDGFMDPVIIRREAIMDLSGTYVPLPPASFIQATKEGEDAIVGEIVAACAGSKRVVDLFSGIGTFTFPLAKSSQVLAVEGAQGAIDALKYGSDKAVGLKQIITKHRDLFRRPLTTKELSAFDAIVFDPPRAGAKDQAEEIAKSNATTVVAVSCNPNTFSRDARILVDGGYTLDKVVPVDQFLWSPHVELVGVFKKTETKTEKPLATLGAM